MLQSSQLQFVLDLSVTINAIVIDEKIDYYSPPVGIVPASSEKKQHQFEARDAIPYLPERYTNTIEGIDTFFDDTKNHLNQESRNFYLSLINQIQGWDD